ncbi:hypothetical protein CR513_20962, partial [Mucuna pruriens]
MVRSMIGHSSLSESLCGEALKTAGYIFNKVSTKAVNKTLVNFGLAKTRPYRPHERKLDSRTVSCYFVGYAERSWGYKFYDPTSRSFFETGNARILGEVERSIRERRHAIPDDYIVFLQEHEDDISLTEDDPINFCQAMQSSNSQKWINSMKDELKSM